MVNDSETPSVVMNKPVIAVLCLMLACSGCEKKEPKPVVAEGGGEVPSAASGESGAGESPFGKRPPPDQEKLAIRDVNEKPAEITGEARETYLRRTRELRLNVSDIKAEIEKTGRVVRDKAAVSGQVASGSGDSAVTLVVKTKFATDSVLSPLRIDVDTREGVVTLRGTVRNAELVGRAILLSLDTSGVTQVVSLLAVETS